MRAIVMSAAMAAVFSMGLTGAFAADAALAAPAEIVISASGPASQPAPVGEPIIEAQVLFKAMNVPLQPLVETVRGGKIDWTDGQILAIGEGQATGAASQQIEMAKRAARLDAARNAVLLLGGIRIGPSGTFKNVKEGTISTDAVLTDFKEAGDSFDPKTLIATVTLKMPLHGAKGAVSLIGGVMTGEPAGQSPASEPAGVKFIVIDARGSGFLPCVRPAMSGPDGKRISTFASYRAGVSYGRVNLRYDLPETRPGQPASVGTYGQILIVRAQKSPAKSPGTIVVADADAAALDQPATAETFKERKVIILADTPQK